ncbi:hypothetical protein Tco_0565233 [Tanacetum coccineum]
MMKNLYPSKEKYGPYTFPTKEKHQLSMKARLHDPTSTLLNPVSEGENNKQVVLANEDKLKSIFIGSDDDEDDKPTDSAIEIDAPSHGDPQTSGSSYDQNQMVMVIVNEVMCKVEEPAPKRLKLMLDIPKPIPLNSMGPISLNNIPFDQFFA